MSDDVARVVGSSGGDDLNELTIAGKKCTIRALSIKELGEIERTCLKQFIRTSLEVYKENEDLLGEDATNKIILEQIREMSMWDVTKLPLKEAHDFKKLRINGAVEQWVADHYPDFEEEFKKKVGDSHAQETVKKQRYIKQIVATALDDGSLKAEQYEKMTGVFPTKQEIGYVSWWITGSFNGMLEMAYQCFQHNGITKEELSGELGKRPSLLISISREIEALSAPQVGNT